MQRRRDLFFIIVHIFFVFVVCVVLIVVLVVVVLVVVVIVAAAARGPRVFASARCFARAVAAWRERLLAFLQQLRTLCMLGQVWYVFVACACECMRMQTYICMLQL